MIIAALGVLAALAFVLGLGALSIWLLKRFAAGGLTPKSRVQLEVVQRVALGPKNALAVVRVGEKVMAVSMGDGGIRTLFELDEQDRQRVLATSKVPTALVSSDAATTAFAPSAANAVAAPTKAEGFGLMLRKVMRAETAAPVAAVAACAPIATTAANAMPDMFATTSSVSSFAPPQTDTDVDSWFTDPAKDPAWIAAVATHTPKRNTTIGGFGARTSNTQDPSMIELADVVPPRDRAFRSMLRLSMSTATRLAVFSGFMLLGAASPLWGQTAGAATGTNPGTGLVPPVAPAVTPANIAPANVNAARVNSAQPAATPATPAVPTQSIVTPRALEVPALLATPQSRTNTSTNTTANTPVRAAVGNRQSNGANITPQGAASRRPVSQMTIDSMKRTPEQQATAAQPAPIAADDAIMQLMPQMDVKLGGDGETGGLRLNGTVGIVVMMGLMTLLPTLLLMMTGFTRILIVLHFLKQAMGTQSAPPAHLLAALALLLTGFVMTPTLSQVNKEAVTPWLDGKITQVEMMKTGVKPMREFMLRQTRQSDLKTFVEMSRMEKPETVDDVPLHVLMSAFVASELRTAFQIGFAIYLPFIIIDTVVASVLMSMGMFMLPPAMISLPFKLLLFVLVDGWSLTITSLVQSFK